MAGLVTSAIEPIGREHEEHVAVQALTAGRGVVITGSPGIGKTHLARRVAARFRRLHPDLEVLHLSGADPAPTPWLTGTRRRSMDTTRTTAATSGDGGGEEPDTLPGLVVVEDAQLLVGPAVERLTQGCRNGWTRLIATAHTTPPWLGRLTRDGILDQLRVPPFEVGEVHELVRALLGDRVSADVVWSVWQTSIGNPRYAIDLVEAAVEDNQLCRTDGTWLFTGPPTPSSRLLDLVASDLATLTPAARDLVDIVGLGGPTPLDVLTATVGGDVLDDQVSTGTLVTGLDDATGRPIVRTRHPRFGDLAAMLVAPARRRALFDRVFGDRGLPDGPPEHLVHTARWALSCAVPVSAGALSTAALAASDLGWHDATETLTTAALHAMAAEDAGRVEALLVRSETRRLTGRTTEAVIDAENAHAAVASIDAGASTRAHLSMQATFARANLAQFGQGDLDRALAITDAAAADPCEPVRDTAPRDSGVRYRADRAMRLAYGARFSEADATVPAADELTGVPPGPRLDTAFALAFGDLYRGLLLDVQTKAIDLVTESNALGAKAGWGPAQGQSLLFMSLVWAGDVHRARSYLETLETSPDLPGFVDPTVRQLGRGIIAGARQDWADAVTHFGAAAARFRVIDGSGWLPTGLTWLAAAQAASGNSAGAAASLAEARALPLRASGLFMFGLWDDWWRIALTLGSPDATGIARSLVDQGRTQGLALVELWGWHALALLAPDDAGEDAVERLDELAKAVQGSLPALRADHARALIQGDAPLARALHARLTDVGFWVPAGATTAASELTARQLEVARLAASGLSSAEIAERLFISKRTVDAHLANIYDRLSVRNREGLSVVLSATTDRR